MGEENGKQAALEELLRSEGWEVLRNEVIEPIYQQLLSQLKEVRYGGPVTTEMGAELAAQARIIEKFIDGINDFLGK